MADTSTILLVDDEDSIQKLLTYPLERDGFKVVHARDGEEGLELIRAHGPAAVVLDIRMPGLDGWQVLTRVREDQAMSAVPVIIVSILDERSRGMTLGATDYLVKPVGREELVGALRRVGAVHSGSLPGRNGRPATDPEEAG